MRRIKGAQFLDFEDCESENFAAENLSAENCGIKNRKAQNPRAQNFSAQSSAAAGDRAWKILAQINTPLQKILPSGANAPAYAVWMPCRDLSSQEI